MAQADCSEFSAVLLGVTVVLAVGEVTVAVAFVVSPHRRTLGWTCRLAAGLAGRGQPDQQGEAQDSNESHAVLFNESHDQQCLVPI